MGILSMETIFTLSLGANSSYKSCPQIRVKPQENHKLLYFVKPALTQLKMLPRVPNICIVKSHSIYGVLILRGFDFRHFPALFWGSVLKENIQSPWIKFLLERIFSVLEGLCCPEKQTRSKSVFL